MYTIYTRGAGCLCASLQQLLLCMCLGALRRHRNQPTWGLLPSRHHHQCQGRRESTALTLLALLLLLQLLLGFMAAGLLLLLLLLLRYMACCLVCSRAALLNAGRSVSYSLAISGCRE